MRYEARWSNGFWKTFDSKKFEDVESHLTKRAADETVAALNGVRRK
jgi:hypothetical protein